MFVETEVCRRLLPIASAIPMNRFEKSARAALSSVSVLSSRRRREDWNALIGSAFSIDMANGECEEVFEGEIVSRAVIREVVFEDGEVGRSSKEDEDSGR